MKSENTIKAQLVLPDTDTAFQFLERKMVPVSLLFVELDYQRGYHPTHAKKLAAEFDPTAFGIIKISQRGNRRYAIIDGQHRVAAARMLGIKEVPCEVIKEKSKQQEAHIFEKTNYAKNLTRVDRFNSALFREDEKVSAINEIVTKRGFRIGGKTGPTMIAAVAAVQNTFEYGKEILIQTMDLIKECWFGKDQSLHSNIIKGIGFFLNWVDTNGICVSKKRIEDIFRAKTPRDILQLSSKVSGYFGNGSQYVAVALAIGTAYNHQLMEKNKIPIKKIIGE